MLEKPVLDGKLPKDMEALLEVDDLQSMMAGDVHSGLYQSQCGKCTPELVHLDHCQARNRTRMRSLTQYINAQYQASTKNGNFFKSLLKKYPSNRFVFGLTTSLVMPKRRSSRLLHRASPGAGSEGDATRWSSSSEELERGLERPESVDAGDDERECGLGDVRCRLNMRYRVLRFIQVPPNNNETTTSGSIKAPAPMLGKKTMDAWDEEVGLGKVCRGRAPPIWRREQ